MATRSWVRNIINSQITSDDWPYTAPSLVLSQITQAITPTTTVLRSMLELTVTFELDPADVSVAYDVWPWQFAVVCGVGVSSFQNFSSLFLANGIDERVQGTGQLLFQRQEVDVANSGRIACLYELTTPIDSHGQRKNPVPGSDFAALACLTIWESLVIFNQFTHWNMFFAGHHKVLIEEP